MTAVHNNITFEGYQRKGSVFLYEICAGRYNNLGPDDGVAWGQWMAVAARASEEVKAAECQPGNRSALRLRRLALHDNPLSSVCARYQALVARDHSGIDNQICCATVE